MPLRQPGKHSATGNRFRQHLKITRNCSGAARALVFVPDHVPQEEKRR